MGPLSTYQQQVQYLARTNQTDSPKQLFLSDLTMAMMEWQAEGDLIILVADLNKDICDWKITQMLRSVGLVDIVMALHWQQPPATHNQGSTPINRIFVPVTLTEYCQVGYLVFGDAVPSNHCTMAGHPSTTSMPIHSRNDRTATGTQATMQRPKNSAEIQPDTVGTPGNEQHGN